MRKTPKSLEDMKKKLLESASPRRATAINAIFDVCSSMLDEGLHISVVSVGERTSQISGGPTARTIYNTADPYGNFVQAFVDVQSSQKPGEILANSADFELPSLDDIISNLSEPQQKAALREFEHASMKVRDRMRILEGFISKITAQEVAQLTNGQHQNTSPSLIEIPKQSAQDTTLGDDERNILQNFIQNTLFDEGYEVHDGDIFHSASGRSLRAERFVQLIERFTKS